MGFLPAQLQAPCEEHARGSALQAAAAVEARRTVTSKEAERIKAAKAVKATKAARAARAARAATRPAWVEAKSDEAALMVAAFTVAVAVAAAS